MAQSTHHRDYQALLEVLRLLRQEAGVTQVALADRLDNTQTFVSKVERGERRLDLVEFVEWCEALELQPQAAFLTFLDRRESTSRKLKRRPKKR